MKKTQKELRKQVEEFLDERYAICIGDSSLADTTYYKGALKACELLGYNWVRKNGEHKLFKD